MKNLYRVVLRKPISGFYESSCTIYAENKTEAVKYAKEHFTSAKVVLKHQDSTQFFIKDIQNLTIEQYKQILEWQKLNRKERKKLQIAQKSRDEQMDIEFYGERIRRNKRVKEMIK